MGFEVKLCSIKKDLFFAWQSEFSLYKDVEIILGDIFQQTADAIVSPANSFGFMDGGLDALICEHLGKEIETKLQEKIEKEFYGELPVGNAAVVETNNDKFPYLISAPTMRVPMRLENSINPYLATRAVFIAINEFNKKNKNRIRSVTIPGMGAGTGGVLAEIAAKQMRVAYETIVLGNIEYPKNWRQAKDFHDYLIS